MLGSRGVVGMDVSMKEERRLDAPDEVGQACEAPVGGVVGITKPSWWRVRHHDIDRAAIAPASPPRSRAQAPGSAGLLSFGVLVRSVAVPQATTEARHTEPGYIDHPPVGVDRARRPWWLSRQAGPHHQPVPGL